MTRKLSLLLIAVSLLGLATAAPAVGAAGLAKATPAVGAAAPATGSSAPGAGSLIAPESTCPGQAALDGPVEAQKSTMLCMVDYARRQAGLPALVDAEALDQSAWNKAEDVIRCDSFSHFACGRDFTYWMRQTGYMSSQCWHVGENLAWGTESYGTVGSIFRAWMKSPAHRQNILEDFAETGISLEVGTLEGLPETHVWTEHFGSHCQS